MLTLPLSIVFMELSGEVTDRSNAAHQLGSRMLADEFWNGQEMSYNQPLA